MYPLWVTWGYVWVICDYLVGEICFGDIFVWGEVVHLFVHRVCVSFLRNCYPLFGILSFLLTFLDFGGID